jgi:hypothetical protein
VRAAFHFRGEPWKDVAGGATVYTRANTHGRPALPCGQPARHLRSRAGAGKTLDSHCRTRKARYPQARSATRTGRPNHVRPAFGRASVRSVGAVAPAALRVRLRATGATFAVLARGRPRPSAGAFPNPSVQHPSRCSLAHESRGGCLASACAWRCLDRDFARYRRPLGELDRSGATLVKPGDQPFVLRLSA